MRRVAACQRRRHQRRDHRPDDAALSVVFPRTDQSAHDGERVPMACLMSVTVPSSSSIAGTITTPPPRSAAGDADDAHQTRHQIVHADLMPARRQVGQGWRTFYLVPHCHLSPHHEAQLVRRLLNELRRRLSVPWPALVSMRMSTGGRGGAASSQRAANLKLCAGTTRSSWSACGVADSARRRGCDRASRRKARKLLRVVRAAVVARQAHRS